MTLISIDSETTGVDFNHGSRPFFVTLCRQSGEQKWWEWEVNPYNRIPRIPVKDLHEIQAEIDAAGEICGHNIRFDVKALGFSFKDAGLTLRWSWEKTHDSLIAGHLLASNKPHNLTDMVLQYLDYDIEPMEKALEEAVTQARRYCRSHLKTWAIAKEGRPDMPSVKEKTWRTDYWLPSALADTLGYPEWEAVLRNYSNTDSATSLALWLRLRQLIEERDLWAIYKNRMKLLPVASELERRGATFNRGRAEELLSKFELKLQEVDAECVSIAKECGYDLVMPKGPSSASLSTFVFEVLRLPVVKRTESGAPSLDSKVAVPEYLKTLELGSRERQFIVNVAKARRRHSSIIYLNNYLRFGLPDGKPGRWMRLYTSANPTGTDTLRWSFKLPNTSNVSKLEIECIDCGGEGCSECNHTGIESFNLRYCLGPAAGREWWSFDYENLELRIPAYESGEQAMIDLFEKPNDPPFFGSYHLLNASIVYPDLFGPICHIKGEFKKRYAATQYQWIKNAGFALIYGCQQPKFDQTCQRTGAYQLLRVRLPRLFALSDKWMRFANKRGYVETVPDRDVDPRKGYPIMVTRTEYGKVLPTVPLNYHVQSTAMHCTNKAMIRWHEKLQGWQKEGFDAFQTLQVHDQIVIDAPYIPNCGNYDKIMVGKRLMEKSGTDIGVPIPVDAKYIPSGKAWTQEESPNASKQICDAAVLVKS